MESNKKIKDYDNILKIIVNNFTCHYSDCGSHKIELQINIDKEELMNFLSQNIIKGGII